MSLKHQIDKEGENFIVQFEKIRYKAYKDHLGFSIGIGHYIKPDEPWLLTATLTDTQVRWLFKKDLVSFEKELNRVLGNIQVTERQFNALMSLLYNVGLTKFMILLPALQIMDKDKIAEAFLKLDKGIPAIRERRLAELTYFWDGKY